MMAYRIGLGCFSLALGVATVVAIYVNNAGFAAISGMLFASFSDGFYRAVEEQRK